MKGKKERILTLQRQGRRQGQINLGHPLRLSLLMLLLLALFYFLFIDLRVYVFIYGILSHLTSIPWIIYPASFIIGLAIVGSLYYQINCPLIEDGLSIGMINKFVTKSLEDPHSHQLIHSTIFLWLVLTRFISYWLGPTLGISVYLILWGGTLILFLARMFTFAPLSVKERKYFEAKTRWARTRSKSPHWSSVKITSLIFIMGELLLYILYFLSY